MTVLIQGAKLWKIACAVLLLLLAGCRQETLPVQDTTTQGSNQNIGLTAEEISTLGSLQKLDEYPFYVMRYSGKYDYPHTSMSWSKVPAFGCSLFAGLGEAGDKLYGRNFDWEYSPAMLVFTDPLDGYASASMVDLTFVGIDADKAKSLTDLDLMERKSLLAAPSMPFDGMNEYGLSIGMAALPDEYLDDASYDPSRPTLGSIGIIRQVLDHARNVDEAVDIFKQFNINFSGGPPIHYLVADGSGEAALIEFYQGEIVVLPNEAPWHLATNHLRCIAQGDEGCWRYRVIDDALTTAGGQLDAEAAMQLLRRVKQDITQWSAVYDMSSGDIQVAINGQYQRSYKLHLDLVEP